YFSVSARVPPISTLFPYTTLFRSERGAFAGIGELSQGDEQLDVELADRPQLAAARDQGDAEARQGIEVLAAPLGAAPAGRGQERSEEHTSELQSLTNLVCRLLLAK